MRRGVGAGNRVLLTLLGLILIAAGLAGAAISTGLAVGSGLLPAGLVPPADRSLMPQNFWDWTSTPAGAGSVSAIAVVIGLLALWWITAQIPRPRPSKPMRWQGDNGTGVTTCSPRSLSEIVEEQIERIPGVHKASVTLAGATTDPILEADITVDERCHLDTVVHRVTHQVCADIGTTTGGHVHTASLRFDVGRTSKEATSIELAPGGSPAPAVTQPS